MSIFNWFTGLFSDTYAGSENVTDVGRDSISSGIDDSAINPTHDLVMVGFDVAGNTYGADFSNDSLNINENAINPANGLPMVGGECGVDVEGNAFGTDFSHDTFSSGIDDSFGSGYDDSFSSGGGFDDW